MSPIEVAGLTVFIMVLFLGLFSIVFGLPGTLVILLDVLIYSAVTCFDTIGLKVIVVLILLAAAAEALEFFVGMSVAARFGLSAKGFWASIVGGIIGASLMTPMLLGLGTVLGLFMGGLAGVLVAELIRQGHLKPAFRAGYGAILGRLAGTLVKGILGVVMVIVTLTSIYS
ncbi:MAG: DUF456 domain-containing protein [Syntrophales bacterium]|nr:DUF456 domain-containing protein [Syntrophales bacterium]